MRKADPCNLSIDYNYFENIDSSIKAYLFGFIWADGCISQNRLSIGVKTSDIEVLHLAQKELGGQIKNRLRNDKRNNKIYEISDWHVVGNELIEHLNKWGFRNNPTFSSEFFPCFLLGFFDGDGCIHVTKTGRVQVCFASAKNQNWQWFYDVVSIFGDFAFTEIHRTGLDGHGGSDMRIYGREALRFLDFIYQGNLGLSRKKELYLKSKEIYKNKRVSKVRRLKNRLVI